MPLLVRILDRIHDFFAKNNLIQPRIWEKVDRQFHRRWFVYVLVSKTILKVNPAAQSRTGGWKLKFSYNIFFQDFFKEFGQNVFNQKIQRTIIMGASNDYLTRRL